MMGEPDQPTPAEGVSTMGYEVTLYGNLHYKNDRSATIEREMREAVEPFVWGGLREGQALEPSVPALLGLAGWYVRGESYNDYEDGDKTDTSLVVEFTGKWTNRQDEFILALAHAGVFIDLYGGGTGDIDDLWALRSHNGTLHDDGDAYSWEVFRREGKVVWDGENIKVAV